jgi:hypothetical protein
MEGKNMKEGNGGKKYEGKIRQRKKEKLMNNTKILQRNGKKLKW